MKKEYVISIPKKEANMISQICWIVCEKSDQQPPEKFTNAMLGLACRFNVPGRKRPVYKMNTEYLMGVLDVIGGFYSAANLARQKGYEEAPSLYRSALRLMKTAATIEKQAERQGFKLPVEPVPPTPRGLRLVH